MQPYCGEMQLVMVGEDCNPVPQDCLMPTGGGSGGSGAVWSSGR